MSKGKKNSKKAKPSVKVRDMKPGKDPKGGRKAGKGQHEFLIVKMNDVNVT